MTDYADTVITVPLVGNDVKGYASVHPVFYREEDGLEQTGGYFVYMLHPVMGSANFTLEPENSFYGWKRNGGAYWLTNEILADVFDAINRQKNNVKG